MFSSALILIFQRIIAGGSPSLLLRVNLAHVGKIFDLPLDSLAIDRRRPPLKLPADIQSKLRLHAAAPSLSRVILRYLGSTRAAGRR